MPTHGIYDTTPAARWEDAFLSGNGETGMMVLGDPLRERIVHNHHRFVLPDPSVDTTPPQVAERLEQVRDLLLAGQAEQAQREFTDGRPLFWTQAFHPGPVLHLGTPASGRVHGYRRATDFTTGEISVRWSDGRGPLLRRAFVSRADGVAVVEVTGACVDLAVRLSGDLPGHPDSVRCSATAAAGPRGEALLTFTAHYGVHGIGAERSKDGGPGYAAATRLIADGGEVRVHGDTVHVSGARRVLLLTRLDRSLAGPDPDALGAALSPLPADYTALLTRHARLHGELFGRASLDLGASDGEELLPVADLLARAESGVLDPLLIEALFANGRYLLLSSTGVLPPRLTGLWLGAWGAAWSGDFTTDANLNLQTAALVSTGMPELSLALRDLIAAQIEDWRTNARMIYGTRGVLAPSRTDGEHGLLFHADAQWPWTMWVAGADWMLEPLLAYWQATGDHAFLSETLAPWLADTARFFEDFLTREDDRGRLVLVPSFSPEIGPAGSGALAGVNATMDIAAARHALTTAADVCSTLGTEAESVPLWRALADRLPPHRVDRTGALAEWAWEGLETDGDHRHVSHLYPVWPLHEITPETTPELAAAARAALVARGDENLSAHGSLHRALCAARLRDADLLRTNLLKVLGNRMLFRSLMSSHNPDLETYNADAAHTLPAVVVEALVDARPGVVELLPALPREWRHGQARGLPTRSGVRVEELTWDLEAGSLRAVLSSPADRTVRIRCRAATVGEERTVELRAGEPVVLEILLAPDRPTSQASPSAEG